MGTIESQMQLEIDNFLSELALVAQDDRFNRVTSFALGAIVGLARQVDLLREELVANDIDVAT